MATASFTKLNCLGRCWRKYYYSYIQKIQRSIQSVKPAKGKLIHDCLELHYRGKDFTKIIQELKIDLDKLFDEEKEDWAKLPDNLIKIMRGYMLAYRNVDSGIKTRYLEKSFSIPLAGGKHTFEGRIDWGFEDEQGFWVCDHKCMGSIPQSNFTFGDVQTTLYFKAAQEMGEDPIGVVFNFIKSKPPKQPEILKGGKGVSRAKIDTDIPTYMAAVKAAGFELNDYKDMIEKLAGNVFFKRVRVPRPDKLVNGLIIDVTSKLDVMDMLEKHKGTPTLFHRSIIKDRCEWDCEYCPLCFAELSGQDTTFLLESQYEPRRNDSRGEQEADTLD